MECMGNTKIGGIYVVEATKDAETEHWAAATPESQAAEAVQNMLPPGWKATLTKKRLTLEQASGLRIKGYGVEKLKFRP